MKLENTPRMVCGECGHRRPDATRLCARSAVRLYAGFARRSCRLQTPTATSDRKAHPAPGVCMTTLRPDRLYSTAFV
ncbi:hypothetical protein WJX72_004170 [[Myrmecia] bisecta]|uniref:Uncharacterized protein n=1 Tax=[Myrmecia] bisecta TaxID=41462 RepID=A0AAW1PMJ8_9CHLO